MKVFKYSELEENSKLYDEITEKLLNDEVICYPTETLYGLGCNALSVDAVIKLYQIKHRSIHRPTLILVSSIKMLNSVTDEISPLAQKLMDKFWPGPLTILFPLAAEFPSDIGKILTAKTGKIGVRISSNPVAFKIAEKLSSPILSTSANISDKKGSGSPASIIKNFSHRISLFIDSGEIMNKKPSTLISIEDDGIVIKREGMIKREELEEVARVY